MLVVARLKGPPRLLLASCRCFRAGGQMPCQSIETAFVVLHAE